MQPGVRALAEPELAQASRTKCAHGWLKAVQHVALTSIRRCPVAATAKLHMLSPTRVPRCHLRGRSCTTQGQGSHTHTLRHNVAISCSNRHAR